MPVSNSLRYQVLRRDAFACYYCGARAPEAVLTVDHVVPHAHGGSDDPSNLVSACSECNSGKAATPVDAALVSKVKSEYLEWRRALTYAADLAAETHDARDGHRLAFRNEWDQYVSEDGWDVEPWPLTDNWPDIIDQLVAGGLSDKDIAECVGKAMRARRADSRFAYFIGVARNMLSARHEVAAMYLREQKRGGA